MHPNNLMKSYNELNEQEQALDDIYHMAANQDVLKVMYDVDEVKMLRELVRNFRGRLSSIADRAKIGLGD